MIFHASRIPKECFHQVRFEGLTKKRAYVNICYCFCFFFFFLYDFWGHQSKPIIVIIPYSSSIRLRSAYILLFNLINPKSRHNSQVLLNNRRNKLIVVDCPILFKWDSSQIIIYYNINRGILLLSNPTSSFSLLYREQQTYSSTLSFSP